MGVKESLDGEFSVKPNIPDDWDSFSLTNLHYKGRCYDITYTRKDGICIRRY